MPTKHILITGVAGFIGSNLAEALLERGYRVTGLDNMSQGDERNMARCRTYQAFDFHVADVRDEGAVLRVGQRCDVIVHLAAFKIPRYQDAIDTLMVNSLGSKSIVKLAVENGAKVVAASTSDVYGRNPRVPFREDSEMVIGDPTVRRWSYAISKMFEEQLLFAYHERYGLRVTIMRFFGGYGPNQNLTWWGGPQSVFIDRALDGEPLEVHGDGLQTRSFTYISDHVDGIIRCIEKTEADNQVFNIGATREITIGDLARLIWQLIHGRNSEPKIKLIPYANFGKYEDVMRRVPDISKARSLLQFEPHVDLEDGLKRTIIWQIGRRCELGRSPGVTPPWKDGYSDVRGERDT